MRLALTSGALTHAVACAYPTPSALLKSTHRVRRSSLRFIPRMLLGKSPSRTPHSAVPCFQPGLFSDMSPSSPCPANGVACLWILTPVTAFARPERAQRPGQKYYKVRLIWLQPVRSLTTRNDFLAKPFAQNKAHGRKPNGLYSQLLPVLSPPPALTIASADPQPVPAPACWATERITSTKPCRLRFGSPRPGVSPNRGS
jgi:hypothetical protein